MKPPHLAISAEATASGTPKMLGIFQGMARFQKRRFLNHAFLAYRKCRPKERSFKPGDIFVHNLIYFLFFIPILMGKKRKKKSKLKKALLIPAMGLLVLAGAYYSSDVSTFLSSQTAITSSFVQDSGSLEVYFCPQEDCEAALIQFLDSAQASIHCALFEIDLPSVKEKLLEKSTQVEVKVVTDNDYLFEFNHSFVKADSWGLMHNKFCVIDGKKVSTGSMNPTNNGAHKNNNNLLLIESTYLAGNYEGEFSEMWNGTFKKGNKVRNPSIRIGDVKVHSYFCPEDQCAERVKEELKKAQKSIQFMTFSFTHEGIANILLLKKMENLSISGVMEARQVTKDSQFSRLSYQGVEVVKDGNKNNMHHKVFIIDNQTVITGSFNPTAGGDTRNDENILIIEDASITEKFLKEFEKVKSEAKN